MKTKIIILILAGLMAFSFVLNAPFKTLDDQAAIINNPLVKDISSVDTIFVSSYFGLKAYWRPLVILSYMAEYHFFGLNPMMYYITNIIIHLCTGLVVFFLMRQLLKRENLAFFTALLFIIHPIHATAVTNISGRPILLGSLFYLLSFYGYCLYKKKGDVHLYVMALFLFILSLLCKESAIMLPSLLLFYEGVFHFHGLRKWWRSVTPTLPFWGILAAYFAIRHSLGIVRVFQARSASEVLLQVLTFARGVLTYFRLFIVPQGFHFDRAMPVFKSLQDPGVYLTVAAFCFLIVVLILKRKTILPTAFFFIGWFFLELVPGSQLFAGILIQPGYIALAEHFVYTASVGVFVLIVMAAGWLYDVNTRRGGVSSGVCKAVFLGLLLLVLSSTVVQSIYASSERAMLARTLEYNPENIRIRESYAWAYVKLGLFNEAEREYRKLLEATPSHVRGRISLGKVLCDQKRYAEGLDQYERVENAGFFEELLYDNIIVVLNLLIDRNARRGEAEKAEYYKQKLHAYEIMQGKEVSMHRGRK